MKQSVRRGCHCVFRAAPDDLNCIQLKFIECSSGDNIDRQGMQAFSLKLFVSDGDERIAILENHSR